MAWLLLFFFLGVGVWSFQGGHLMIVVYFILSVVLYVFYAILARCPRCRMPVLLRPVKLFGMELYRWSLFVPERCSHCGEALP
jgi:hypothetical protein